MEGSFEVVTTGDEAQNESGISRQLSTSYFQPSSLASYENYLRAVHYEGFLELKVEEDPKWRNRYCILTDGILTVNKSHEAEGDEPPKPLLPSPPGPNDSISIQLDLVTSVRTAQQYGASAFQIVTPDRTYFFRARSKSEMQDWLFAFHRSLAVIVARLRDNRQSELVAIRRFPQLVKELGHGHGRYFLRRYRQISCEEGSLSTRAPGAGGSGGGPLSPPSPRRGTWAPGQGGLSFQPTTMIDMTRTGPAVFSNYAFSSGGNRRLGPLRAHHDGFSGDSSPPDEVVEEEEEGAGGDRRSRQAASSVRKDSGPEPGGQGKEMSGLEAIAGLTLRDQGVGMPVTSTTTRQAVGNGLTIDTRYHQEVEEASYGEADRLPPLPTPSPMSSTGKGDAEYRLSSSCEDMHASGSCDDGSMMFELSMDEGEFTMGGFAPGPLPSPLRPPSQIRMFSGGSTGTGTGFSPGSTGGSSNGGGGGRVFDIPGVSSRGGGPNSSGPAVVSRGVASVKSRETSTEEALEGRMPAIEDRSTVPPYAPALHKPHHRFGWSAGVVSLQGIRSSQEDRYTFITDLNAALQLDHHEDQAFFAIYDGHCGVRAAAFAKEQLHHYLVQDPTFSSQPQEAFSRVCRRIDMEMLEMCAREQIYCGTTALMCLLRGKRLLVANIGDCGAVLCRGKKAVSMSDAHTPGRPDETARIEEANGWVTMERELFVGQLHRMDLTDPTIAQSAERRVQWVTIHRVCGELSVSRSLGDPDFKGVSVGEVSDAYFDFPEDHSRLFMADLVIPDPEFKHADLTEEDKFLVLACDGFWDVMDGQEAVDHVLRFFEEGLTTSEMASKLGDLAIRFGSSDNVTVMVVNFTHYQTGNNTSSTATTTFSGEGKPI